MIGNTIAHDYRRNKFLSKVKVFLGRWFGRLFVSSAALVFLVGGFDAAQIIIIKGF